MEMALLSTVRAMFNNRDADNYYNSSYLFGHLGYVLACKPTPPSVTYYLNGTPLTTKQHSVIGRFKILDKC